jgi:Domain of unknown function (DUF222)/HNH endonuclease
MASISTLGSDSKPAFDPALDPAIVRALAPAVSIDPTISIDPTLSIDPVKPINPNNPNTLSLHELEAQITELAGHLNAANYRWLMLIAEFDRRDGWGDGSTQSCAHWLSWKCGIDRGAAREKVRVARALEALPMISASMSRGALSYSKVRALTRVATPATENSLLMIALHGTSDHIEKIVRQYRRAQDAAELGREAQQFATRGVSYFYDDDGSLVLNARLPAESGAVLLKAFEVATDDFWRADVSPETPDGHKLDGNESGGDQPEVKAPKRSLPQRRADALAKFAESFLKHGYEALSGGERQQIVVHVDAQTLSNATPGRCELEDGPALSAQTARRLACDSSVVTIVEDEAGEPLNVGRKTRTIAPAIRRALRSRDQGCKFPGCTHTRFLDGHHVQHWADGGETKLSNLVMLCRFHHRQVHEGGVKVQVLNDGALRFSGAQGQRFEPSSPTQGDVTTLVCQHRHHGINIDTRTAVTRWCGERMDHGLAIEVLLAQQERAKARARERERELNEPSPRFG